MNTKHSKGNWKATELGVYSDEITSHGNFYICGIIDPENEEDKANARLIAAAPEMLDCLTGLEHDPTPIDWISALLCEFERHYQSEIDDDPDATSDAKMHVRRFIEKARRAVKKVEGNEPEQESPKSKPLEKLRLLHNDDGCY